MFKVGDIVRLNRTLAKRTIAAVEGSHGCIWIVARYDESGGAFGAPFQIKSVVTDRLFYVREDQIEPFGEE